MERGAGAMYRLIADIDGDEVCLGSSNDQSELYDIAICEVNQLKYETGYSVIGFSIQVGYEEVDYFEL